MARPVQICAFKSSTLIKRGSAFLALGGAVLMEMHLIISYRVDANFITLWRQPLAIAIT